MSFESWWRSKYPAQVDTEAFRLLRDAWDAAANERSSLLEEQVEAKEMVNEDLREAIAAEREVSDKLEKALNDYIQHMNLADAHSALAEVAAIRNSKGDAP